MASSVVEENEIFLNGVYYPTTRPVRSTLASIYPAKVVIGDTTKDSQLRSSIVAWSDWRGGIGLNRMEGAGDINRAWYSTCQLRYKNHLVLPGLVTATTAPEHGFTDTDIGAINTLNDEVYAFWNGSSVESPKLYKYSDTNGEWSALTQSATDQVTDSILFTDSLGVTYLVFAHYDANGSGYTYSSDGSTWTTNTTDVQFLTVWDERLWGISNIGQLWYSTTIGTNVNDAVLPSVDGTVTKLFVARNAIGTPVIYCATTQGLFMHNADNARWEKTQMDFPTHPDNGKGTITWRDSVYIPSGNGIYKYINGNNAAVITVVGPDRDDGLPNIRRGKIRQMAGSHNELLVGIDARGSPSGAIDTSVPYDWQSNTGSLVVPGTAGYSTILGYNELGYEVKWESTEKSKPLDVMHVSDAYTKYRLYWGHNRTVYFMELPKDVINPSEIADFSYATSGVHETPWFNAGQSEVDKLALELRIEAQNLSSTETIKVEYATNYADTDDGVTDDYTDAIATLNSTAMGGSSGTYTYTFQTNSSNTGTIFRSIKFRLTLNRSTADTTGREKYTTPDIVSLTLSFRKKIPAKWGHTVDVDLTREYKGKTPKDLRASLVSAIESDTLVEFTFRDDSGGTRNYYVDVVAAQGMEFTGRDERGSTTIQVVEP